MKVSLPAGDILDFPNMFRTFVPFPVSKNDYTGAELEVFFVGVKLPYTF